MNQPLALRNGTRGMLLAVFASLLPLAAAQTVGNVPDDTLSRYELSSSITPNAGPDPMEARTILPERPGLPGQTPAGAQGPLRSDAELASDPSIRDSNPDTMNGVWEQLSGNRVVSSNPQKQQ